VLGNICLYWEPGNFQAYVSPDAFVAQERVREPPPRVYRTWLLPPILFAAEIGSQHNTRAQIEEKRGKYAAFVRPLELLETQPIDEESGEALTVEKLRLYRWTEEGYVELERQPDGRFQSEVLGLLIGVDEKDNLRLWTPEGERVLTHEEERQARLEERQARLEAEERVAQEARERALAEQRAGEAEERAQKEARERAAAEQRAREAQVRAEEERSQREALERELAALRARLAGDDA
jgi:hypothetical protein